MNGGYTMETISTNQAPSAIGPYSQAKVLNGILYTSGQLPVNPETGKVPEGITAQTRQSCENIKAILEEANTSFDNVIKTTCFLSSMDDFQAFNEVYAEYFVSKPARSTFAVKELPMGVLCEIEVIAAT